MKADLNILFDFELYELLNALRRDIRAEQLNALADLANQDLHLANARASLRLLQSLYPDEFRNGD